MSKIAPIVRDPFMFEVGDSVSREMSDRDALWRMQDMYHISAGVFANPCLTTQEIKPMKVILAYPVAGKDHLIYHFLTPNEAAKFINIPESVIEEMPRIEITNQEGLTLFIFHPDKYEFNQCTRLGSPIGRLRAKIPGE